jgi:hypothetical protein
MRMPTTSEAGEEDEPDRDVDPGSVAVDPDRPKRKEMSSKCRDASHAATQRAAA